MTVGPTGWHFAGTLSGVIVDDLKSAARSVLRPNAVTIVLLVSLGLGTDANAAVFFVRITNRIESELPAIVRQIKATPGKAGLTRVTTLAECLSEALAVDRLMTTLVAACGVVALLMSIIGVYGIMNDSVMRRTREIGLRVALGAARRQVSALVFGEALALSAAGMVLGLGIVLMGRYLLGTTIALPGVDARVISIVPALLFLVIAIAAIVPLRRALRVSPTVALRHEG